MISLDSFSDEMCKIAQIDPQMMELERLQQEEIKPRRMNKEVFKQFLKDTALIAGGAGAGYGAGRLTADLLKKHRGAPKGVRKALLIGGPVVGGGAALALRGMMREEQKRRQEQAYQRGLAAQR